MQESMQESGNSRACVHVCARVRSIRRREGSFLKGIVS